MPFSTEQLAYAGKFALDFYLKNDPVDNINVAHPLLKKLTEGKKPYGGALQYVVENLRFDNDSNFQSYFGDSQVTYNRKRTMTQAKFNWGSFHDGFGLNEDELAANGIIVTDDKSATPSDAEKIQLADLLKENLEALKLGFQANLDLMLHRDGTASATDIAGLDLLVKVDPTTSTSVGTINESTSTWWQNNYSTSINSATAGLLIATMETQWRECTRYGGKAPNYILAGGDFIDAYIANAGATVTRQVTNDPKLKQGGVSLDAGTTGVYFHGVELIWDPTFDILDTLDSPGVAWAKRCYFLNTDTIKLRPITGHWMISRKPPRVYDRYVHYWALTSKGSMTINKRNANAVLAIS